MLFSSCLGVQNQEELRYCRVRETVRALRCEYIIALTPTYPYLPPSLINSPSVYFCTASHPTGCWTSEGTPALVKPTHSNVWFWSKRVGIKGLFASVVPSWLMYERGPYVYDGSKRVGFLVPWVTNWFERFEALLLAHLFHTVILKRNRKCFNVSFSRLLPLLSCFLVDFSTC